MIKEKPSKLELATNFMSTFAGAIHYAPVYPVYMVGGAVRDMILGREPKDVDFSTPMSPDSVKERLQTMGVTKRNIDMQQAHYGVVTTSWQGETYEITTFRKDSYTTGSRKPQVEFTKSLREDLSRRDFNINSLAWDGWTYYGDKDFSSIIPNKPWVHLLAEDGLRLVRAYRFAADLGLEVDWDGEFGFTYAEYTATVSVQKFYEECLKVKNYSGFYNEILPIARHIIPFFNHNRYTKFTGNETPEEAFWKFLWNGLCYPGDHSLVLVTLNKCLTMSGFSNKQKEAAEEYIKKECMYD